MIDNKAQIRELALTVVDGLHKYIHIHNRIYKDSATFKSVVKNLFGFGVPMSELLENAETLLPLWDSIQIKLENYQSVSYANLSQDEQNYIEILSKYVAAMQLTIKLLFEKQRVMEKGSKSYMTNRLSWIEFKEKENAYKNSILEYKKIGHDLITLERIIF